MGNGEPSRKGGGGVELQEEEVVGREAESNRRLEVEVARIELGVDLRSGDERLAHLIGELVGQLRRHWQLDAI